jgi:cytochrome c553
MMRATLLLIAATLFFSQYAIAESHNVKTQGGQDLLKAEMCIACHSNDEVILKNTGADSIAEKMKSIRAGDVKHPPGLENLSDDQIAEIAKLLDREE